MSLKEKHSPYLYNKALDFGLIPSHKSYNRFIILSRSRTGTNMLRLMLNSTSQVVTFGELFKNPNKIGWDMPGYSNSGHVLDLFQKETRLFIDKEVFKKYPKNVKAVGFKIFYYHAKEPELEPVWDYLKEDRSIHVIHLRRNNILKTHISRVRAQMTNNWINLSGECEVIPPFKLDYEELLKDFIQTRAWESEAEQLFINHPKIEITYEQLAHDYHSEMRKIQKFLGLDNEQVFLQTHKQTREPLSAMIENYFELKKLFEDSPWETFFTE
jgi:LPS sulfotransferase NodH